MSISWFQAVGSFALGVVLGAFFFGGLWLSVLKLATHPHPATLLALSLMVRTGIVMLGFYLLIAWKAPAVLLALAGFVLVRVLVVRKMAHKSQTVNQQ